jgi:small conductance mechanosensitive channel
MGYDTKPLLSLLSVSGLTIGFAAKDILTNTFKGLFILLTKPFHRNWTISVNGFRGKVLSIDSRFVKLQSLQSPFTEILIPLSMIYDTAIVIEKKEDL